MMNRILGDYYDKFSFIKEYNKNSNATICLCWLLPHGGLSINFLTFVCLDVKKKQVISTDR